MIDELRSYKIVPGGLADYLKFAEEIAIPFRGDDYGKLLGFWFGEVGAVNSVFNLWQHKDLNTRQALRAKLQEQEVWRAQYLPHAHPLMRQQFVRLMTAVVPFCAPAERGNVYEVRIIRTRTGKAQEVASRFGTGLTADDQAATVGLWTTIAGHLNEVVHISACRDVAARLTRSLQQPEWRHFLGEHGSLVEEIESSLMIPANHSPVQ